MCSVSKMPMEEDGDFAKKSLVAKRNRYKDKYLCKYIFGVHAHSPDRMVCACKVSYMFYNVILSTCEAFLILYYNHTVSTNYLHIAGWQANNAADYINATMMAVSIDHQSSVCMQLQCPSTVQPYIL